MSDDTTPDDTPTPQESVDDSGTQEPTRSRTYRLFRWVQRHIYLLLATATAGTIIAAVLSPDITIPRWLHLGAITGVLVAPYGILVARKAASILWDPAYRYVVDIVSEDPNHAGIYRWPNQQYRENMEVTSGEVDWVHPNLGFARYVDLEDETLEGNWRGSLSDRELLVSLARVRECKGRLLEDAQKGFALRSQATTVVRTAVRDISHHIIATIETGTLPERGDRLEDAVDAAVRQFDFGDDIGDDLDDQEAGADLPDDDLLLKLEQSDPAANSSGSQTEAPADD